MDCSSRSPACSWANWFGLDAHLNLTGGDPRDEGRVATVGIKYVGAPPARRLLLSYLSGPNPFVGSRQSTRIVPLPPPSDLYSFHLDAGQSVSAVAKGLNGSDVHLELLDAGGNVVATGSGGSPLANGSFETGDFTGWTTAMADESWVASLTDRGR
jgi:hypothetical protein